MTVIRWAPFREVEALRRQMDQLFDHVLSPEAGETNAEVRYAPAVEFREQPERYLLKVALPGIRSEDLDIQVTPESVTISAEHRFQKTTEQEVAHRSEFRYGKLFRQLALPGRVDADQVSAVYQDGVLSLTLPKLNQSKVKKVLVTNTPPEALPAPSAN